MTNESQPLVEAIESGELTDAGGMTTTRDVADVVPFAHSTVEETLHALEDDGVVESTMFGNDRVWTVPERDDDSPDETTTSQSIPTSTRGPVETC